MPLAWMRRLRWSPPFRNAADRLLRFTQKRRELQREQVYRDAYLTPPIPAEVHAHPTVLVLVNSLREKDYRQYGVTLRPFFHHIGLPFREIDIPGGLPRIPTPFSLVILAHPGIWEGLAAPEKQTLLDMVRPSGLLSFDFSLQDAPSAYLDLLGIVERTPRMEAIRCLDVAGDDDLTRGMKGRFRLKAPCPAALVPPLAGKRSLHYEGHPLILRSAVEGVRRLQVMISPEILNEGVLGHLNFLSTLFERALVWASRPPFVLKGIPHFLSFRIDDVSGSSGFSYLEPICRNGYIPNLGLFIEAIPPRSLEVLKGLSRRYPFALSPHALTWEKPLYFDVFGKGELRETTLTENFARIDTFYRAHGFPLPRTLNAHFFSVGLRCTPYLRERGIRYVMNEIPMGAARGTFWPTALPYGRNSYNLCFADPAESIINFIFQGFGRSEYLDPHDYDWLWGCTPYHGESRKVEFDRAVDRGVAQIEKAFWAKFPAYLMTHEQRLSFIHPSDLDRILARVEMRLRADGFTPVLEDMDHIIEYLVAARGFLVDRVDPTELEVTGETSTPVFLDVHTEEGPRRVLVPAFSGSHRIPL